MNPYNPEPIVHQTVVAQEPQSNGLVWCEISNQNVRLLKLLQVRSEDDLIKIENVKKIEFYTEIS